MGIHGDKSQQERDWVLNGKLPLIIWNLHGAAGHLTAVSFSRVQIWEGSNSHRHRCCLQRFRSVQTPHFLLYLFVYQKESILLSVTLLLLSEFLP